MHVWSATLTHVACTAEEPDLGPLGSKICNGRLWMYALTKLMLKNNTCYCLVQEKTYLCSNQIVMDGLYIELHPLIFLLRYK